MRHLVAHGGEGGLLAGAEGPGRDRQSRLVRARDHVRMTFNHPFLGRYPAGERGKLADAVLRDVGLFRRQEHARDRRQVDGNPADRRLIERLDDDRRRFQRFRPIEAVLLQAVNEQLFHVDASRRVERWRLQLRIQAGLSADEVNRVLPGHDALPHELSAEPAADVEPANLLEREVVLNPVLPGCADDRFLRESSWKDRRHVARPLERVVMKADQHPVLGHRQVLLDVVGVLHHRESIGGQRVLGSVRRGTTMGDGMLASGERPAARRPPMRRPP